MKTILTLTMIAIACIAISSCKKQIELPRVSEPFDAEQKTVATLTREVASILEEVYRDRDAYLEATVAIFSGYYADERVMLNDLLHPDEAELYRNSLFEKHHVHKGRFRKRFLDVAAQGAYPNVKAQLVSNNSGTNISAATLPSFPGSPSKLTLANVSIYFPYSEEFGLTSAMTLQQPATLVASDRNADSGPGREPYLCGTVLKPCYRDVSVDDAYAIRKPTHIVGMGADVQPKPAPVEVAAPTVHRVYHGWSRLTKQMDKLISFTGNGGGSEIKLGRISAYLKTSNQQVTGFTGDLVTVYFTRGDIRKQRWKRIFSVWDPNWATTDKEEVYAVYEEDTEGTTSFNGNLSTTLNVGIAKITGELGFDVKVKTQDEILAQRKFDRASYYKGALMNQGWGFVRDENDFLENSLDWPIYDGAAVWQFSLANREF